MVVIEMVKVNGIELVKVVECNFLIIFIYGIGEMI